MLGSIGTIVPAALSSLRPLPTYPGRLGRTRCVCQVGANPHFTESRRCPKKHGLTAFARRGGAAR